MTNATMQSKIVNLMRQSRQASRLYASVRHIDANHLTELARIQSEEWRVANDSLCKSLGEVLKRPSSRHMGQEVLLLTEHHRDEWRIAEKELHQGHKNLCRAIEQSDYVASTVIASTLVRWKARKEAQQAVYDELLQLIKACRVTPISEKDLTEQDSSSANTLCSSEDQTSGQTSSDNKGIPSVPSTGDLDQGRLNQLAENSGVGASSRLASRSSSPGLKRTDDSSRTHNSSPTNSPHTTKSQTDKSRNSIVPPKYDRSAERLTGKIIPLNRAR